LLKRGVSWYNYGYGSAGAILHIALIFLYFDLNCFHIMNLKYTLILYVM